MKRSSVSVVGSVLTAIVASVCCVGPALLALLGAGTVGFFGSLGSYRPYFIGLTVILVGTAFYLAYRKREVKCEDGTCKTVTGGKWDKASVWFAAFIAALIIVLPYMNLPSTAHATSPKDPSDNRDRASVTSGNFCGDSCCTLQKESETGKKEPRETSVSYNGHLEE